MNNNSVHHDDSIKYLVTSILYSAVDWRRVSTATVIIQIKQACIAIYTEKIQNEIWTLQKNRLLRGCTHDIWMMHKYVHHHSARLAAAGPGRPALG